MPDPKDGTVEYGLEGPPLTDQERYWRYIFLNSRSKVESLPNPWEDIDWRPGAN